MVYERLGAAGRLEANRDPVKQFAIKRALADLQAADVIDPGPKQLVIREIAGNNGLVSSEYITSERANSLRVKFSEPLLSSLSTELKDAVGTWDNYYDTYQKTDLTVRLVQEIVSKEEEVLASIEFTDKEKVEIGNLGLSSRVRRILEWFKTEHLKDTRYPSMINNKYRSILRHFYDLQGKAPFVIDNAGALSMRTREELMSITNFGQAALEEVELALARLGLGLATEE